MTDNTKRYRTPLMIISSIMLLMGLVIATDYVDISKLSWTHNPFTQQWDYVRNGNWSDSLDNNTFPAACPTYSAITQLGTSVICTDYRSINITTYDNNGTITDNGTCTIISSPDGSSELSICNV